MESGFPAEAARRIVGITQRCLDYWDERDVVRPSIRRGAGKGSVRAYSFRDLVRLSVVKELRDGGVSLQKVRRVLQEFRRRYGSEDPLGGVRLVTDGRRVYLATDDPKALEEVLGKGQLVFAVAVGDIETVVKTKALRLRNRLERQSRSHRRLQNKATDGRQRQKKVARC